MNFDVKTTTIKNLLCYPFPLFALMIHWQELINLRPGVVIPEVYPDSNTIRELDTRRSTTLKYKEEYCYEYDNLLIAGKTPQQFIDQEIGQQQALRALEAAEEEAESGGGGKFVPALLYVGLVLPRHGPTYTYTIDLCHIERGDCMPGGWAGMFCPGCHYDGTQVKHIVSSFLPVC